jgi:hypothetical protein
LSRVLLNVTKRNYFFEKWKKSIPKTIIGIRYIHNSMPKKNMKKRELNAPKRARIGKPKRRGDL